MMKKNITLLLTFIICLSCFPQTIFAQLPNDGLNEVQIGYQYFKVSDFVINETDAGMLQKGKQVRISITDYVSEDMIFNPDFEIEVIGDLKIKNYGVSYLMGSASSDLTTQEDSGSYIYFNIEGASSEASSIKFTNLHVKIDRTVPVSNDRPYDLIVWGTAIAENYGEDQDQFRSAGISIPYAIVVDPQTGNQYFDVYKEDKK